MSVSRFQTIVAECYRADKEFFASAIGRLIDALLFDAGDEDWYSKFPNYIDGVLFDFDRHDTDFFTGYGLAIIGHKQYVEPLLVELWFDPLADAMTRATLCFGMKNSSKPPHRSSEAKKVAQSVMAMVNSSRPKIEFEWRHEFELANGEWSNKGRGLDQAETTAR